MQVKSNNASLYIELSEDALWFDGRSVIRPRVANKMIFANQTFQRKSNTLLSN